jgi:hypothetical protein
MQSQSASLVLIWSSEIGYEDIQTSSRDHYILASPVAVPGDSVTVKVTNHPGNLQQNVTFKLSRLDSSERVPISPDSVVISYSTKYTLGFISSSARTERQ